MLKRTQCKNYSKESKKPMYKRVWFWAVAIIIVAGTASCSNTDNSKEINSENAIAENKLEDKVENTVPAEYKSALEEAQSCSDITHCSKARTYDKLTSGYGFTAEAAQYAVDNVKADWKENALHRAKAYAKTMSKAEVYDMLISDDYGDKFTAEAAQYAIDNVKADWKKNALESAKSYQETMSMSPSAIYDQLVSEYGEQFTAEEAQYAIDNLN